MHSIVFFWEVCWSKIRTFLLMITGNKPIDSLLVRSFSMRYRNKRWWFHRGRSISSKSYVTTLCSHSFECTLAPSYVIQMYFNWFCLCPTRSWPTYTYIHNENTHMAVPERDQGWRGGKRKLAYLRSCAAGLLSADPQQLNMPGGI